MPGMLLMAITKRSILMPPEVEPEQPQTIEHSIRMPMQHDGQVLVSAVAKPVVVESEQTWKAERRSAFRKVGAVPLKYRLQVTIRMAMATSERNQRTTCELKRFLLVRLSGQTVENNKLKLVAPNIIATMRMASTPQLL